jgi:DNA-binding beta-propeller fold protein YncE
MNMKYLFALVLLALLMGLMIPLACSKSPTGPATPRNTPTATPTTTSYPTVAPTQSPTPPYITGWIVNSPNGLAEGNGFIYVAEGDGQSVSQVQLFNSSTNAVATQWTGYGGITFIYPVGVAVNQTTGSVYVLDQGNLDPSTGYTTNSWIYEFSSSSTPTTVGAWGGYGSSTFEFPSGIALDSTGNVYVTDSDNFAVEEFGSGGSTIGAWDASNTSTTDYKNFYPTAVALDSGNNIYVLDAGNFLVWKLSSITGTPTSWPIIGSNNGTTPFYGLSVDSNGNVFVADYTLGLVEVYNGSGVLIGEMTGQQTGATPFVGPTGVMIFGTGIYVADYGSSPGTGNVQEFGPDNY